MKSKCRTLVIILLLVSAISGATVIHVGPAEYYTSIKWAYNQSNEGDTLIVKDGTYTENIIIEKSITLLSENRHGAVIGAGDGTKGVFRIREGSVVIDGFTLNSNGSSRGIVVGEMDTSKTASNCIIRNNKIQNRITGIIVSPNAENTTIMNNLITGSSQNGITMSGRGTNTFSGNRVLNNVEHGVFLAENHDATISMLNDTIIGNGKSGLSIEANNVTVKGALIEDNGQEGILTNSGRHDILISEGNCIKNNRRNGVAVENGTSMVIENNEILENDNHGIIIYEEGSATVTGNAINGNRFNGIMCYGSVTCNGNTLTGNIPHGIEVLGSARLENNTISESEDLGIFFQQGSSALTIKENLVRQNGGGGLVMATGGQVQGNTFDGNRSGINVEAAEAVVHIMDGNEIINQVEHGILVAPDGNADIVGNTVSGNGTGVIDGQDFSGIFISGSASVRNNVINNNGASGIRVMPEAGEVTVNNNPEINGNREGIYLTAPTRVEGNKIQNSVYQGIYADEGADSSVLYNNLVSGNSRGIVIRQNVSAITVLNCDIISNTRGLVSLGHSVCRRNTIEHNTEYGILILRPGIDLGQKDEANGGYNTIRENSSWNIENRTADTVFACHNYWGCEDSVRIDSTISDNEEDSLVGPVIFIPMHMENVTGLETPGDHLTKSGGLSLSGVYPNPFMVELVIKFTLEVKAPVHVRVYGIGGQIEGILTDGQDFPPGDHLIRWDGRDPGGGRVSSGFYIVELRCGQQRISRIVQLVRH